MGPESMWIPIKWVFYYVVPGHEGHLLAELVLQPGTSLQTALTYIREKIDPKACILAAGDGRKAYIAPGKYLDQAAPDEIQHTTWERVQRILTKQFASGPAGSSNVLMKMNLSQIADVNTELPDADFWIVVSGTKEIIGMPVREYQPEHAGISIFRPDLVAPESLFHYIQVMYSKGTIFPLLCRRGPSAYHLDLETIEGMPIMLQI